MSSLSGDALKFRPLNTGGVPAPEGAAPPGVPSPAAGGKSKKWTPEEDAQLRQQMADIGGFDTNPGQMKWTTVRSSRLRVAQC